MITGNSSGVGGDVNDDVNKTMSTLKLAITTIIMFSTVDLA